MKNLFTTRALLKQLSREQKQVLTRQTLQGRATAAEWLAFLGNYRQIAQKIGGARGLAKTLFFLGIVVLIVGAFTQRWWLCGIGAVSLLVGVVFMISFSGKRVPANLLRFVAPIVAMLKEDTGEKSQIELKLDFRGPTHGTKRAGVRKWPRNELPRGARSRNDSVYVDPMVSISTKLIDGSKMAFSVTDQLTLRRTTKTSRSGKRKTKGKYKFKRMVAMRLRPPGSDYRWLPELVAAGGEAVTLENGMVASIKSEPGVSSTLVLRSEKKSGGAGVYRNRSGLLNPDYFIAMMDVALQLVEPPASESQIENAS